MRPLFAFWLLILPRSLLLLVYMAALAGRTLRAHSRRTRAHRRPEHEDTAGADSTWTRPAAMTGIDSFSVRIGQAVERH